MLRWSSSYDKFEDDEVVDEHQLFQSGIKEVLLLNDENLLKIRKQMSELWLKWEAPKEE